jgi:Flp pilus assembly protein TadD
VAVISVAVLGAAALQINLGKTWRISRTPTFSRDVAPIVFTKCAACHRPGGMGPFALLDFVSVKKHARQIVEVTNSRFMPPWLPDEGPHFAGERRLRPEQISIFQRWLEAGAPEGKPADLPAAPRWSEGWQLGKPDLVIAMPEAYTLATEGRDIYRNFVVPIPIDGPRFVRAVELQPSNPRVVHHAFLLLDASGESRRLDAKDDAPGFDGMNAGSGAGNPGGHFLSWQPGATPSAEPVGTQWMLRPGMDAVFQIHMRPSGKPERVGMSAAFYFTNQPPSTEPFRLLLRSTKIDIPPGEENYAIESSYKLPVDIDILAVLPHAHYLGRDLQGWAELPDGSRKTIISIRHWDFNWQDHYRYAEPLSLPKGTTLRMRYIYDNSSRNPVNAEREPRRVQFGEETSDEMGELWLQVVTTQPGDRGKLEADYVRNWAAPDTVALSRSKLERDPNDAETRINLGAVLAIVDKLDEAIAELQRAIEIDPNSALAHSDLGQIYMRQNNPVRARTELEAALAIDPENYKARNNLGYLLLVTGDAKTAAEHFERVLRTHPDEVLARRNLERARAMMKGVAR